MSASALRRLRERITTTLSKWRSSLALRVATVIMLAGALSLALTGLYISTSIRDGLFDARLKQVLSDALWRAEHAQSTLNDADVQSTAQVQRLVYDLIYDLRSASSGTVGVLLLPAASQGAAAGFYVTDRELVELISEEMRAAMASSEDQLWQSVAVPSATGTVPGVVVGQRLNVPLAGNYEFYTVYSLASEQHTVDLVMRVMTTAGFGLLIVLTAIIWLATWQILRPVRQAAQAAERIAAGVLEERMVVRGRDELATLAQSFNQMAASLQEQITKLEELSRVQRRFVSDVSHELRTPLTTVRMAADVIYDARSQFTPATKRAAELLATQLDRFESLLADLLEISRFDAGAAVLAADDYDVRSVIEQVVEMAAPLASARNVVVGTVGMDAPVTAQIDPRRIERVIRNLVINAIEHSDNSRVVITLRANVDTVAVRVRDWGIGMSATQAAHVFDRFWRADPARARTVGGSGLGLAIALEDARLHGGDLQVWGRKGRGAAFLLLLPRHLGAPLGHSPLELADRGES
ncbi:MAG: MtrAB system histidine kinase MtrB [Bowdeniella nasicola]|nr:MtrAB system histidine kinase MtrB [Bowdeniella nasicola]